MAGLLERYKQFLPSELRKGFYDIVVIHPTESDQDEAKARDYVQKLKDNVRLTNGEELKVTLFDDFALDIGSLLQKLGEAVKRCGLTFIYITDNFSNTEYQQKFFAESALAETINNPLTRDTVVPIFDSSVTPDNIPMYLSTLCGLYVDGDPYHFSKVGRIVETRIKQRKDKEDEQEKLQQKWAVKFHQEQQE